MSETYIDETAGDDESGSGTQNAPYKSLAYALFKHDGPDTQLLIRKDAETPYDKPTDSSLKKAKKGADGLRKKAAKAAEIAEREAKEREEADKRLEESKKIVLVEDETLPASTKVRGLAYC
jgi:asparaginyl-tRNA synthetase